MENKCKGDKVGFHQISSTTTVTANAIGNLFTYHEVNIDLDQLYGLQVVNEIMKKPEFTFLIRYYSLLYQSFLPNCQLAINTLCQHYDISSSVKQYILNGSCARICSQRLLNFLIIDLDNVKDYQQFCFYLHILSMLTTLPSRILAEFHASDNWASTSSVAPQNLQEVNPSRVTACGAEILQATGIVLQDEAVVDGANKCFISHHHKERFTLLQRNSKFKQCKSNASLNLTKMQYDIILQSLPTNFENTLDILQDHLTDDQICTVLSSPNSAIGNKTLLDFLIKNVQQTRNISKFCDALEQVMSSSKVQNLMHLVTIIKELRETVADESLNPVAEEIELPQVLTKIKEFNLLKQHYHTILHLMPNNYEHTVGRLQDYISDEQICAILCSTTSVIANKLILDCLINRMSRIEHLRDFCNQLEIACPSQDMKAMLKDIGYTDSADNVQEGCYPELKSWVAESGDNKHHQDILRKHYYELYKAISNDIERCVAVLLELDVLPDEGIDYLYSRNTTSSKKEAIVDMLIVAFVNRESLLPLCDVVEALIEDPSMKVVVQALRNDCQVSTVDSTYNLQSNSQTSKSSSSIVTTSVCSKAISSTATNGEHLEGFVTANDSRPTFPDLYQYVKSKYAVHWEELGAKLGLSTNHIAIISKDNAHNPNRTTDCCKAVLVKWLEIDLGATWGKLKDAINSTEVEKPSKLQSYSRWKYYSPPPMPQTHIPRPILLEELSSKVCGASLNSNCYETTVTVTGAGGFGKTTLVTAVCYHPAVKKQFTDGFILVELGPQATDPTIKLSQLYHLITGSYLSQCDINQAEQEIRQLTKDHNNFLVIIDDVWHVEDAEPIVKAFCNCKIVLTTRMSNLVQFIPTKETVEVGEMEKDEALSLLTHGVINGQLLPSDACLLNELAEDLHLWPLLLSLVKGQLSHNLKQYKLSVHNAIRNMQIQLRDKGLTGFDKNNIDRVNSSRKFAVKVCIDITLELLSSTISNKMKTLILFTGIGTSSPVAILHCLWKVSEQKANDITDTLWAYGLIQFIQKAIPMCVNTQTCIEVHAVISQYVIDSMNSAQVASLTPFADSSIYRSVDKGLVQSFQQSYGIKDVTLLNPAEYLKFIQSEIEHVQLPTSLKMINMRTVLDPHIIILMLQQIQAMLMDSPDILALLAETISNLKTDCDELLKDVHKLSRKLNQKAQCCMHEKRYENLIQTIENYCTNYPVSTIAVSCLTMVKSIPCNYVLGLDERTTTWSEILYRMAPDYHYITHMTLPRIELYSKLHRQITDALEKGSPSIEETINYYTSGKYNEELQLFWTNYCIKLKEVAPISAQQLASRH